jgi:UDP-N-acetylmuramoyl-tripeptide--D-alanyl-D-alanine ligase
VRALYEIFLACGGRVSTDSRGVERGSVFFALRGERFDGNRYAADALAAGAAFAVVDDGRVAVDDRYLVVDNALLTLQHLAAHHRRAIGGHVLAITGTNGKTTTKELVARVLAAGRRVTATEGNLNNHIGVPLTLLTMRAGDFGVVEMGASAEGEIRTLCDIAAPDYGLITNTGRAHLEGFGGEEGVRRAKGELYDYLAAHGGVAFVRRGDGVLVAMARERDGLAVRPYDVEEGYGSALTGDYNRYNVAAAVAVGREFDVPDADIRAAIASYAPSNNRSQSVDTGRNTLVMDCYNANPSSMRAALEDFAAAPTARPRAVILGDMAELGTYAAREHEVVVALLAELGLRQAYLVGEHFADAVRSLPEVPDLDVETFADVAALADHLRANPITGHSILLKASRSIGLERLRELL